MPGKNFKSKKKVPSKVKRNIDFPKVLSYKKHQVLQLEEN